MWKELALKNLFCEIKRHVPVKDVPAHMKVSIQKMIKMVNCSIHTAMDNCCPAHVNPYNPKS
jgi:hypothetical protein